MWQLLLEGCQAAAPVLLRRRSESSSALRSTSLFLSFLNKAHTFDLSAGVVTWAEVEWMFHQSVLESMPLTKLDQQGVLLDVAAQQNAVVVSPWDNPLAFAKKQLCRLQVEGQHPPC